MVKYCVTGRADVAAAAADLKVGTRPPGDCLGFARDQKGLRRRRRCSSCYNCFRVALDAGKASSDAVLRMVKKRLQFSINRAKRNRFRLNSLWVHHKK